MTHRLLDWLRCGYFTPLNFCSFQALLKLSHAARGTLMQFAGATLSAR